VAFTTEMITLKTAAKDLWVYYGKIEALNFALDKFGP
jgi:hypothetical protein